MIYGVDCASYQGHPDWSRVKESGISFAFSKVTQGTGYVNPTWDHNRAGMLALGADFMPGCYHFLEEGADAAAQVHHFLDNIGHNVADLSVALDVEPASSSRPTARTARAWVAEFKRLTNDHPVLGYFPGWYWQEQGQPDISFFDSLWQSRYVSGSGSAAGLYGHVPGDWWGGYGGGHVGILQYSDNADVPGISGGVDANAFKGTVADLRTLALGGKSPNQPPHQEDDMPYGQLAEGAQAITPIALPRGRFRTIGFTADNGLQQLPPAQLRIAIGHGPGKWQLAHVAVDSTKGQTVVTFDDQAATDGISVRREDKGDVHVAFEVS